MFSIEFRAPDGLTGLPALDERRRLGLADGVKLKVGPLPNVTVPVSEAFARRKQFGSEVTGTTPYYYSSCTPLQWSWFQPGEVLPGADDYSAIVLSQERAEALYEWLEALRAEERAQREREEAEADARKAQQRLEWLETLPAKLRAAEKRIAELEAQLSGEDDDDDDDDEEGGAS